MTSFSVLGDLLECAFGAEPRGAAAYIVHVCACAGAYGR